ncbi:MAG: carboxypeptidase regulatory-like domain-containing protein [Terracidiphilus sp.]
MKLWTRITMLLIILFGLGGASAFAQFSSGIEGIVHDTTGALVPNAKVTVTNTRLGVANTVLSGAGGYFRIDGLPASTFDIQIQAAGFETWKQEGLALQIAEIHTITPELKVGAVSTNVEVSATAAQVDLETPATGAEISTETVTNTPLTGQNVYSLASLTPGMTGGGVVAAGQDNFTNEYAINLNAAGLRQEQNGYEIDDAYTNTPSRAGATSISPSPEVVSSEDVLVNNFDAQKGRNGGATIDIYTKSGSNQFHGAADYYFTNNSLTATTHFGPPAPFSRNEVAGAIGGPIWKNKLFLFGAYDRLASSVASAYTQTVETQDFLTWAKTNLPNNIGTQILATAPPQNYPSATAASTQTVSQYEAATPGYYAPPAGIPSTLDIIGVGNVSFSTPKDGYQWSIRGDTYIRSSDRLYVDVLRTNVSAEQTTGRPLMDGPVAYTSDFVNINWTHTFNSHLFNQAGGNVIRPYGANEAFPNDYIPYVNVNNLTGFGTWAPGNYFQTTWGWHDVMTATVKTHTLKFGADFYNIREVDHQDGAFDRPTFNFQNILDLVQDEATSSSGPAVNLTTHQEAPYDRIYRAFYEGYYLQDDWKLTPRLTVNLGVREDIMVNFASFYSPHLTNFILGSGSTENAKIAGGSAILGSSPKVLDHNIGGFTPRVGFSWDVFGKGKTAVRGGFGLFADQPPYLHITDITSGNLPNFYTPSNNIRSGTMPDFQLCSKSVGWDEACPIANTSNATIGSNGQLLIGGVVQRAGMGGYDPNLKMTQVNAWSLSVQQQLQNNLIVELNYSGTESHHLESFDPDVNRFGGDLIQNNGTQVRLNPYFGGIAYAFTNTNSAGNYGTAMATRTYSHGLAVQAIYTYGKSLDTMSNAQTLTEGAFTGGGDNVIETQNFPFQRGRSDFDIRQQFQAAGTWDVPHNYSSAVVRSILGGWQFGGKFIGQTGIPFTVYTGAAYNPTCTGNATPNAGVCPEGSAPNGYAQYSGDFNADGTDYDLPMAPSVGRHLSGQSKTAFLKGIFGSPAGGAISVAAGLFHQPAFSPNGSEGNLGRNTYDQPSYKDMDFTFEKYFNLPWFFSEKIKIEAKGEVFNLFQRSNLWTMDGNITDSTFGEATNQLPARSFQMHIRASF